MVTLDQDKSLKECTERKCSGNQTRLGGPGPVQEMDNYLKHLNHWPEEAKAARKVGLHASCYQENSGQGMKSGWSGANVHEMNKVGWD